MTLAYPYPPTQQTTTTAAAAAAATANMHIQAQEEEEEEGGDYEVIVSPFAQGPLSVTRASTSTSSSSNSQPRLSTTGITDGDKRFYKGLAKVVEKILRKYLEAGRIGREEDLRQLTKKLAWKLLGKEKEKGHAEMKEETPLKIRNYIKGFFDKYRVYGDFSGRKKKERKEREKQEQQEQQGQQQEEEKQVEVEVEVEGGGGRKEGREGVGEGGEAVTAAGGKKGGEEEGMEEM